MRPASGKISFLSSVRDPGAGFTVIEIVITVSIVALVGTMVIVSFVNSRNVRELVTSGQNVLSVLRLAQSKTLGGEANTQWGVRLEQTQVILFQGQTFSGSPSIEAFPLPRAIELVNVSLAGGGQDVVFEKIDGRTDEIGTFELRVKSSSTNVFSITVDASGKTYQTGIVPVSVGTRRTDARHRDFTLGWTIANSITLTLIFSDPPNPDTITSITMAPPPPRTVFDWSGTIAVGGQNQILRIHANSITGSNTVLSVDRDCRDNTKKLRIAIDGQDIVTYEADCQTITVGPFGGTMAEP